MKHDDSSHFPHAPANVRRRDLALAEDFARRLWAVSQFDPMRRWFQHVVRGHMAVRRTDARHLWTPRPPTYPTYYQVIPAALRVADPAGTTIITGYNEAGDHVTFAAAAPAPFLDEARWTCRALCACAGFHPPTDREMSWAAMGLLWPANSPEELAAAFPAMATGWSNVETGELVLDPGAAPPDAEYRYLRLVHDRLRHPTQRPPEPDWNPRGRRSGTGVLADLAVETYVGLYRKLAADYATEGIRRPSEADFATYLEDHFRRKLGKGKRGKFKVKVTKAQSKAYREGHGLPWPPI